MIIAFAFDIYDDDKSCTIEYEELNSMLTEARARAALSLVLLSVLLLDRADMNQLVAPSSAKAYGGAKRMNSYTLDILNTVNAHEMAMTKGQFISFVEKYRSGQRPDPRRARRLHAGTAGP